MTTPRRVLSGMRPTGALHLGNYHGALRNWIELQYEYDCYFFVADYHALTTGYEDTGDLEANAWRIVIDWLAAGVNPSAATLFIQSKVPEHAELHLLLVDDHAARLAGTRPDLQGPAGAVQGKGPGNLRLPRDTRCCRARTSCCIARCTSRSGEDQVAHVEITREIARRFNFIYGREADFEAKAERAVKNLGAKKAALYRDLRRGYQERGEESSLVEARALLEGNSRLTLADKERLLGYLEGTGRTILPEPEALLTATPKVTGLDGRKMSKSYGNTIGLREDPDAVAAKLRTMQTDPARVRRTDPGDPEKCPVWDLHKLYSSEETRSWVDQGCRSAGIGCIECKKPLIDRVVEEVTAMRQRGQEFEENPDLVRGIIADGCEKARAVAGQTLDDVKQAMGLGYR